MSGFEHMLVFLQVSILFWPILALGILVLWVLSEHENFFWSSLLAALVAAVALARWPAALELTHKPIALAAIASGYVLLGVGWAFVKWYILNRKQRTKFINVKNKVLAAYNLSSNAFSDENVKLMSDAYGAHTEKCNNWQINGKNGTEPVLPVELVVFFKAHADFKIKLADAFHKTTYNSSYLSLREILDNIIPKANEHKKAIMMWGVYWPLSATWFALNDLVTEIATFVYERLVGVFTRISNHMFKESL